MSRVCDGSRRCALNFSTEGIETDAYPAAASIWVYHPGTSWGNTYFDIFMQLTNVDSGDRHWRFYSNGDGDFFHKITTPGADSSNSQMKVDSNVPVGTWTCLYGYWNTSTDYDFYVDGTKSPANPPNTIGDWGAGSKTIDIINLCSGGSGVEIVAEAHISTAAIWKRPLTPTERSALFAGGNPRTINDDAGDSPLHSVWMEDNLYAGSDEDLTCPITGKTLNPFGGGMPIWNANSPPVSAYTGGTPSVSIGTVSQISYSGAEATASYIDEQSAANSKSSYAIVQPTSTQDPSAAQVKAGLDGSGSVAAWNGGEVVHGAVSAPTRLMVATGLTPSTDYKFWAVFTEDGSDYISSSALFSTTSQDVAVFSLVGIDGVPIADQSVDYKIWSQAEWDADSAPGLSGTDTTVNGILTVDISGTYVPGTVLILTVEAAGSLVGFGSQTS